MGGEVRCVPAAVQPRYSGRVSSVGVVAGSEEEGLSALLTEADGGAERMNLHGAALNLSNLLACACHVPLASCQAPRRPALDTHTECSARRDRHSILQRGWDDAGGWQKAGNKA